MAHQDGDPLPSWNDGAAKQAILSFVTRITQVGGPDFVPVEDRVATFDNDGTLWVEKPLYVQGYFALDRIRSLVERCPELRDRQPYKALLDADMKTLSTSVTKKQIIDVLLEVSAGMEPGEFSRIAGEWLARARHPRYDILYTDLIYQPMLELLNYLRSNGFKVFIVSGGGIDFLRIFSEEKYGIPRENVVGSSLEYEYGPCEGGWRLMRVAKLNKYDDAEGKPESIALHIGRRPIIAAGNSDGDLAMMRYTADDSRMFLNLLLHHDDSQREWAYDRESLVGRLSEALDEAVARNWTVISMKRDWNRIFHFE
jgi:phosphoserine phosphatase